MENYGNFSKSYVRTVEVRDIDGKPVEIVLKYTARTPLLYLNYFGTDMFDDLARVVLQTAKNEEVVKKLDESGAESLSEDDLKNLDAGLLFEFFNKFAAALVATAHHPKPISYDTIASTMLPEDFITDPDYEGLFIAVRELFTPVLDDYKKKLERAIAVAGKKRT